mgnify:CR=1 FL=1
MENDGTSSGGRLENIKGASYDKTFKTASGGEGKTAQPGFARGKCPPLVLRTTFPSASGGTIGTIRTSCRTRHSERSEESRYMVQMRGLVINTHLAGRRAPVNVKKASLEIKPSQPPQGRGGNHTAGLRPLEMHPFGYCIPPFPRRGHFYRRYALSCF